MLIHADTLDDLLRRVLKRIIETGNPVQSSRGPNTELTCVLLKLSNPLARLSHTETKGKVFSPLGELAWYLAESNRADFITYYIPLYGENTENDGTIRGAYGPRLFSTLWHNQFENVAKLLKKKPCSRRAAIQLFDGGDLAETYLDIPCTCTLQFMIRAGRLDMVVLMRSNDAYLGLSHDVFSFTMLQEILARVLGIELGEYSHFAGSLHLYDAHREGARSLLEEGVQGTVGAAMPVMPLGDPWPGIRLFLVAEESIRTDCCLDERIDSLDPYWQDLVRLLRVFRHSKDGEDGAIEEIKNQMAHPFYNEYIAMRLRSR